MNEEHGWIKTAQEGVRLVVAVGGRWTIAEAARLDDDLGRLSPGTAKPVWIDMGDVERPDTAVAWILYRTVARFRDEGYSAEFTRVRPEQSVLLELVHAHDAPVECRPPSEPSIRALVEQSSETKLFCVGDDWQSIFRFTGSDLSIIVDFKQHFGYSHTTSLNTTYRFHNRLDAFSEACIQKNTRQLKK